MENKTTVESLYEKDVKCPLCSFGFKTKRMRKSKVKVRKIHSDFYTEYDGENPNYYAIFVCPNCGYSSFDSDFPSLREQDKAAIYESITKHWRKRSYECIRTPEAASEVYKLASLCYRARGARNSVFAKISLRLSWICRDIGDEAGQRKYEEIAADCFEKAFTEDRNEGDGEEIQIMFMAGELNRRLGRFDQAIRWFAMLLRDDGIKRMRQIELRARKLWDLAIEENRSSGGNSDDNG